MGHGKKPLDFGGNPVYLMLELGLWLGGSTAILPISVTWHLFETFCDISGLGRGMYRTESLSS